MVDEQLRASDADRERVADRLRRAQAEGRITLLEFDERVAAAYAAVTYADLAPLTADLPTERSSGEQLQRQSSPSPSSPSPAAPSASPSVGPFASAPALRRSACGARSSGGARGPALAFRVESAAWLFASLLNLLIWALVSVAALEPVHPWWIWVAGPWGAVLLLRRLVPRRYAGR